MKIDLEKEYANCIQNPISKAEKQMAMNVGSVILTKVMTPHEFRIGLMGGEELSPAEYLDPLVELPAPQEGWLERYRLYKNIYPAWHIIHKIHKCELPEGEYEGNGGGTLGDKAYKMWRYAQAKQMKVKSYVMGIDFYVTPDMTEEEVKLAPEMAILNHGAEMENMMETDTIDVEGHTQAWAQHKKKHPKDAKYAERLALMAQAEMKAAGKPLDMEMFARVATFQDQIRGDNGNHQRVVDMLFTCWKYGLDLAKVAGRNTEEIERARKVCADVQKKPVNDGPEI